jgi:hypothetical protein
MRGHGLNNVGYSQDPRFQYDLLPRQTLGITRTIHSLVMLQHDLSHRPWKVYGLQYFITNLGVGLDQTECW